MPSKRVDGLAAIGVDINARETLAEEVVGNDPARRIDRRTGTVDRCRALWVPAGALFAHVLHTYGPADGSRHHRCIHRRIVGVAAAIGARAHGPDRPNFFDRNAEYIRNSVPDEMRFLRTGPASHFTVLDLHDGAGGAHAGMRLERPLILGFDHTRGGPECLVGVTDWFRFFALAYRRLADVVVERSRIGKRRRGI